MNEQVRKFLIETARTTDGFAHYGDIVTKCHLPINLESQFGRNQLSNLLGEVSEFENSQKRPLISAMAIYKDKKKNDHGDGFYVVAEKLKKKSFKKLKAELFAFKEADECRKFWQNEENYRKYFSMDRQITQPQTLDELFLSLTKDNEERPWKDDYRNVVENVRRLQKAIQKNPRLPIDSNALYKSLSPGLTTYRSFMHKWLKEHRNGISSRGQSVLSADDFETIIGDKTFKVIARTVIDTPSNESYLMLAQWWSTNEKINNRPLLVNRALAACDPTNLSSVVDAPKFWKVVQVLKSSFGFQMKGDRKSNWYQANVEVTAWLDKLLGTTLRTKSSSRIEQIIWRNIFMWLLFEKFNRQDIITPNTLTWVEAPTDGPTEIVSRTRTFSEIDIDYERLAREQKELGDAGESLVKQREIDFLNQRGMHELARRVDIVKDGRGFDVVSFDEHGNEKFIEVKTTTGDRHTSFFLSQNEIDFMRLNKKKYCIYRVFQYDQEFNSGKCFSIGGDVESQLTMKPTQFRVAVKGRKKDR